MSIAEILSDLKAGLARLDQAIAALEGALPRRGRPPKTTHRKRTMSTAARKGTSAPKKTAASGKKVPTRKPMSAAARKKLSALAKLRWAERKKAGASSL